MKIILLIVVMVCDKPDLITVQFANEPVQFAYYDDIIHDRQGFYDLQNMILIAQQQNKLTVFHDYRGTCL